LLKRGGREKIPTDEIKTGGGEEVQKRNGGLEEGISIKEVVAVRIEAGNPASKKKQNCV